MKLKSVDLTVSLESLSFFLAQGDVSNEPSAKQPVGDHALSHVDARGTVRMVDVGDKAVTAREAVRAEASRCRRRAPLDPRRRSQERRSAPDRAAGRASWPPSGRPTLIPLCHPLALTHVT